MKEKADAAEAQEAEVIDIMPFIKARKNDDVIEDVDALDFAQTLSDLVQIMELSTDDIAGTLVARLVYEVDLLPDVTSKILFDELDLRIRELSNLSQQLKGPTK